MLWVSILGLAKHEVVCPAILRQHPSYFPLRPAASSFLTSLLLAYTRHIPKQSLTIVILAIRSNEERRALERGTRRAELLHLGYIRGQRGRIFVYLLGTVWLVVHAHLWNARPSETGCSSVVTIRKEVKGTNGRSLIHTRSPSSASLSSNLICSLRLDSA